MKLKKIYNFRVVLLAVTFIILVVIFNVKNSIRTDYLNYDDYTFLNLQEGISLEQKFNSTQNYLQSISLFFVNIFPDMGNLILEISNLKGEIIFKNIVDASQLVPGEFNKFDIKKYLRNDEDYILRVKYTGQGEADYIGILAVPAEKNLKINGDCIYGGKQTDVNMVALYETKTISWTGVTIIIAAMVIIVVFIYNRR